MQDCYVNAGQELAGDAHFTVLRTNSIAGDFPRTGIPNPETITVLLSRVSDGDREAFDHLIPLVYQELHRIAEGYCRRELQNHTLQPTALIHEAYLRMLQYGGTDYQNRTHFFGIAARVMRQVLVDHARARQAAKRGADLKTTLDENLDLAPERDRVVIALDDALNTLAAEDDKKARLVEMRFFGGMTAEEIAECVDAPVHVVRRELRAAQAWLRREIEA
jgi:RNA polymerase sigma factor (TIGR02999 family)